MAEPVVLTTLRLKADAIRDTVATYEAKIIIARRDLSAVLATMALFSQYSDPSQAPAYLDLTRIFRRGELSKICLTALRVEGPLDTRELSLRAIRAKRLDDSDPVRKKRVASLTVQALGQFYKRGLIGDHGKRKGVRLWCHIAPPPVASTPPNSG
jgi:hypothetical protein